MAEFEASGCNTHSILEIRKADLHDWQEWVTKRPSAAGPESKAPTPRHQGRDRRHPANKRHSAGEMPFSIADIYRRVAQRSRKMRLRKENLHVNTLYARRRYSGSRSEVGGLPVECSCHPDAESACNALLTASTGRYLDAQDSQPV